MLDFKTLLEHYGYIVLLVAFILELIALPVPGEVLLSYCGLLVYQGRMNWIGSMLVAGLGACIGITLSYGIGYKLGQPFFEKYGRRIHLGPEKLEKTAQWFSRYGNKVLVIGYFIPGVRHITGYFSGVTRIPYRTFSVYAYLGAFLYTGIFISLGKVLGPKWEEFHTPIKKYLIIAGIIAVVVVVVVYLYRKYKQEIFAGTQAALAKSVHTFHSLGRVRFFVAGAAVVFLGLFALMAGMIQDLLAHEFSEFDVVTSFVVHVVMGGLWSQWMRHLLNVASYRVMLPVAVLTFLWVLLRGKNRRLEAFFLLLVLFGGEGMDEGLRRLFHRVGPDQLTYTFPSEACLIVIAVYGFAAYLLIRHQVRAWIRTLVITGVLVVALWVGLANMYLDLEYPSDVAAGYVFGGVWLSLNIVLLEIFRQLRRDLESYM